jgi:hypothetical protein
MNLEHLREDSYTLGTINSLASIAEYNIYYGFCDPRFELKKFEKKSSFTSNITWLI